MGNFSSKPNIDKYIQRIEKLENQLKIKKIKINPNIKYENIIFEGGGVKGISFCGAIYELEKKNILQHFIRYAGSSAGAITATLLAIGYNASEIRKISMSIKYHKFLDDKRGFIRDAYNLLSDYGICSGEYFYKLIGKLIKQKTNNSDYTFKNLYDNLHKELVITGTDLSNMTTQYYNHNSCPDMPIRDAVRISMSIPYLFIPLESNGCFLVDGGTINNYPIQVFDKNNIPNKKTIGLKIITPNESISYKINTNKTQINNIKDFTLALVNTLQMSNERLHMNSDNWDRTIPIELSLNIPITKFNLTQSEKNELYKSGQIAINKYLPL